jgi:hypothetical protein
MLPIFTFHILSCKRCISFIMLCNRVSVFQHLGKWAIFVLFLKPFQFYNASPLRVSSGHLLIMICGHVKIFYVNTVNMVL